MRKCLIAASILVISTLAGGPRAFAQPVSAAPAFADLADLALASTVIAHVRITRAVPLPAREAGAVPPGFRRHYVEADVAALIRGPAEMPARLSWLIDLPADSRGRSAPPRRRGEYLLFAHSVAGRPGELRLAARDAMIPYDPASAATLREIVREALSPDSPPRITGFGRAFHVPGSLPGESETQIFLETADGRPVSLTILRRPGAAPNWSVALGEMVDEAAEPPRPDSLLWYRLACQLPSRLPASSLSEASSGEAGAIAADYRVVLDGLGPCVRQRAG